MITANTMLQECTNQTCVNFSRSIIFVPISKYRFLVRLAVIRRLAAASTALWILSILAFAPHAGADESASRVRSFMSQFGDRMLAVYADAEATELRERVARTLLDAVDFNALSGSILGYTGLNLTERERLGLQRKITVYVIDELLTEIGNAGVDGYEIISVEAREDGRWLVDTEISTRDDDVLDAGWLVGLRRKTLKISDIEIDGFSLVRYFGTELDRVAKGNESRLRRVLNGEIDDDSDLRAIVRKRVVKRRRG